MENKKRFEFCGFNLSNVEQAERWVRDNVKKINFGYWDFDKLTDLLNEQDEKIAELREENQQLQQSQNSKTIEVLIGVKQYLLKKANNSEEIVFAQYVNENYIDNQLIELKEKK